MIAVDNAVINGSNYRCRVIQTNSTRANLGYHGRCKSQIYYSTNTSNFDDPNINCDGSGDKQH